MPATTTNATTKITTSTKSVSKPAKRPAKKTSAKAAPRRAVNQSLTIPIVTALDRLWSRIRVLHPEVPNVVLTIGAGSNIKGSNALRFGHFAEGRWQHGDNERLAEVFISGEGLRRPAPEVLGTLLHEAAHGLGNVRDIKNTSRQGRYHNTRFKALAEEVGLTVTEVPVFGWSHTEPAPATIARYTHLLDKLTTALVAWRHPETVATNRPNSNNGVALVCDCERRIRVSTSTHEQGPITCGLCDSIFQPAD